MVKSETQIKSKATRKNQSYWGEVFYRLRKNKLAMMSFFMLIIIISMCIFVPMFSKYSIETYNAVERDQKPNSTHLLGTDKTGRDLFVRLFYAGRISLGLALAVVFLECTAGVILGSLSGFYGGIVDIIIMRIAEIFMSFPFMIFCITIVAVFGNSIPNLIFILALLSWPSIARIVRGQILTLREMEYMEACEALGISDFRRIFKHLLPNVLAYVIVYATLGMASVILTETSLSFLGLGVSPPTPTWGNMIQEARNMLIIQNKWWYWIPPGICIFISVMCFNILGDGMRDAIDPKMKR
ncbi:MAG: binding-protein-dependent transport system inner rane component [Sedimentibacter sp.]|jgi:peptide/nickel transport system permease protein|nr:binding-protein-dependent transport system inner rane component [Sedimentibacter sp.]